MWNSLSKLAALPPDTRVRRTHARACARAVRRASRLPCGAVAAAVHCAGRGARTLSSNHTPPRRPLSQVYCAHEYGESNAKFAAGVNPSNAALAARKAAIDAARARVRCIEGTVPRPVGDGACLLPTRSHREQGAQELLPAPCPARGASRGRRGRRQGGAVAPPTSCGLPSPPSPPSSRPAPQGEPTVPSLLREEVATNPFLRPSDPELRAAAGLPPGAEDWRVFGALRAAKDGAVGRVVLALYPLWERLPLGAALAVAKLL